MPARGNLVRELADAIGLSESDIKLGNKPAIAHTFRDYGGRPRDAPLVGRDCTGKARVSGRSSPRTCERSWRLCGAAPDFADPAMGKIGAVLEIRDDFEFSFFESEPFSERRSVRQCTNSSVEKP